MSEARYLIAEYVELVSDILESGENIYLGGHGSFPSKGLTQNELISRLCEHITDLSHKSGFDGNPKLIKVGDGPLDELHVMLRWSNAPRNSVPDIFADATYYESIDVIQIAWAPENYICGATKIVARPKNLAVTFWKAMKEVCRRFRRVLFVESVCMRATALHQHLVRDLGFIRLPYFNFMWIPDTAHPIQM